MLLAENRLAAELPLVQNAVLVGFTLHILVHGSHGTGHGILCHTPVRDKQLGDFFLDGKLLHIGSGTHGGGIAPVIDGGQAAAAVDVLKGQAILRKYAAIHGGYLLPVGVWVNFNAL